MTSRVLRSFVASLLLCLILPLAHGRAQEPTISIVLERQTPWVNEEDPQVSIEVLARNDGNVELADLSMRLTMFAPAFSRSDVEQAFVSEPADGAVVIGQEVPLDGSLAPGQQRSLRAEVSLASEDLDTVQSYVYPLRIDLVSSAAATPVATLRSAVVVITVDEPVAPIALQTTVPLVVGPLQGPAGVFLDASLEAAIAPNGRFTQAIDGMRAAVSEERLPLTVDLVIAPLLLTQLDDMTDGYRVEDDGQVRAVAENGEGAAAARATLEALRTLAASANVKVSALPYAGPTLPSLRGPLSGDLQTQVELGRATVDRLLATSASRRILMPRRSAIDAESLERITSGGTEAVLLSPLAVPPPELENGLSPPPTASLEAGRGAMTAVVATQSLQNLVTSELSATDPVLAAQQAFAMMATVWLEQPGIDGRGMSLLLPEAAQGRLIAALAARIGGAPFLDAVGATELEERIPPPDAPTEYAELDDRGFGATYVDTIRGARRRITVYRSMLVRPSPVPDQLDDRVLLSEAAEFLDDPTGGEVLLGSTLAAADRVISAVRPIVTPVVTLTSRNGQIPYTVANEGPEPVRVIVQLLSPQLEDTGTEPREIVLASGVTQDIVQDVRLGTTGQFPVRVVVRAPIGRPISEETIIVRSTAYSRIALYITIGAALVLVALWARRFLRRTTS
ncbi:MAG: DUF6049 family protein [Actinomycetota bacterium]